MVHFSYESSFIYVSILDNLVDRPNDSTKYEDTDDCIHYLIHILSTVVGLRLENDLLQ